MAAEESGVKLVVQRGVGRRNISKSVKHLRHWSCQKSLTAKHDANREIQNVLMLLLPYQ